MQGEWFCYRGGQFNGGSKVMLGGQVNGGRMVMLHWWSVNGGKMVMLQRWSVYWKENGHVIEVVTLMEGERTLQKWSL